MVPAQGSEITGPDLEGLQAARSAFLALVGNAEPADGVQLQQEAARLGQRYFDLACESFMTVAQQGLERAKKEGTSSTALAEMEAHVDHVSALTSEIGSRSHDIGTYVSLVDEINETRTRLRRAIEQAGPLNDPGQPSAAAWNEKGIAAATQKQQKRVAAAAVKEQGRVAAAERKRVAAAPRQEQKQAVNAARERERATAAAQRDRKRAAAAVQKGQKNQKMDADRVQQAQRWEAIVAERRAALQRNQQRPNMAPPGWYVVPNEDRLRWWDGSRWTEHFSARPGPQDRV